MTDSLPARRASAARRVPFRSFQTVITPHRLRPALLLGASGLALALGALRPAAAADECGVTAAGGTATCTPAGNNFPGGIKYTVVDLTIVVEDGVIIDASTQPGEPGGIVSGDNGNYGDLVINAGTSGGSGVIISTDGAGAAGIFARTNDGSVTITSYSEILAVNGRGIWGYTKSTSSVTIKSTGGISTGSDYSDAIQAYSAGGTVSVTSNGLLQTNGKNAAGIDAYSGTGNVYVTSIGEIITHGFNGSGIDAGSGKGKVEVTSTGDINTDGDYAYGISALASAGSVKVSSTGDIETKGYGAAGILGIGVGVYVKSVGDIVTQDERADGIRADGKTGATIVISTGDITTFEYRSKGIVANVSGDVTITSMGDVTTHGKNAAAIYAESDNSSIVVTSTGDISTEGIGSTAIAANAATSATIDQTGTIATLSDDATGIVASAGSSFARVTVSGEIETGGANARGISARSTAGNVQVYAHNAAITTTGDFSTGIYAKANNQAIVFSGDVSATGEDSFGVRANAAGQAFLSIRGDVLGGWDTGAGILIAGNDSSQIQILSGASVGSMSDVAIANGGSGDFKISNSGTITGWLDLSDGDQTLNNISNNSFNLRNFADTDGDGTRDTEAVAVSFFGNGADTFNNTGTLRLSNVSGATTVSTSGQLTHPGGGNSDITQVGVEQGFLLGLESFDHSGTITLQDGVAGDLLVITDQNAGSFVGNNVFTSNGGTLALDVVLDDGSSKQSDVLILDKAVTGTGPTRVVIANAGGAGGQTTGDGIMVVNVRTDSDADAFTLGGQTVTGTYKYELFFQNEAGTDENWYLRSTFFQGAVEYPSIVTGALMTWYSDLGVLHERLNQRRREVEAAQSTALPTYETAAGDTNAVRMNDSGQGGWFRVSGADMDIEQDGPSDFDLQTVRAEAGFDVGFNDVLSEDWLVLGAFGGYGWSGVGFDEGANLDFDIATVGAYATYFRGPYYLDALVKFDWLDGDYDSEAVSGADIEIPVIGFSLETGYRFDIMPSGLYLQPQAQLSYAHAGDDSFKDDSGAAIELDDADSLRGRLGLRLGQELSTNAGVANEPVRGNFYFEASVNQEFLGDTDARVTGVVLEQELPETTFEIGGGVDIVLPKDGITFTLDADYITGDDVDGVAATGGIRINW